MLARLEATQFVGADLTDSDLTRSNLKGANFQNANVSGASFDQAFLWKADFTGAIGLSAASFENAWSWSDDVPEKLNPDWITLCTFNEDLHQRYELPFPCQR